MRERKELREGGGGVEEEEEGMDGGRGWSRGGGGRNRAGACRFLGRGGGAWTRWSVSGQAVSATRE